MNNKIEVPQPKFGFGQRVVVVGQHREVVYKPCSDCAGLGQITLVSGKSATCPTCRGSKRDSFNVESVKKWKEIDGELVIEQVHIELVAPGSKRTLFWGDNISPVAYQGCMHWSNKQESQNVFHESSCYASREEAELAIKEQP